MTNKVTDVLNSAKGANAIWSMAAGVVITLFWVFGVSDNGADAMALAIKADGKADLALLQNGQERVKMAELNGKLDVTNTKMTELNKNIERLLDAR
jgi:hypothetical protein